MVSMQRGAVDLSALSNTSVPTNASTQGGAGNGVCLEATQANIQELASNSARFPVIFVFFSPRAESSTQLADDMCALAVESGGRFQVAKVNADTSPEIAQSFGVRGVPCAYAMLQGQLAPLFEGAPDKQALVQVVNQVLQAAMQGGLTGRVEVSESEASEPAAPPHHREGQAALETGDLSTARAEFEAALKENPGDSFASTALAQVAMLERLEGADVNAALTAGSHADIRDCEAQLAYGDALIAAGKVEEAFAQLIKVISVTAGDDREKVRLRLIELFDIVGGNDPRVLAARRNLASALF